MARQVCITGYLSVLWLPEELQGRAAGPACQVAGGQALVQTTGDTSLMGPGAAWPLTCAVLSLP